jgi:uncharacterized protein YjbJ (UPF0337 family)
MVDENRIKGAAQGAMGTVEESLGVLTGDSETQAAGKARQAAGEAQRAYGRASDRVAALFAIRIRLRRLSRPSYPFAIRRDPLHTSGNAQDTPPHE